MGPRILLVLALAAAMRPAAGQGIIHTLIRNNLAGTPDNFRMQRWSFDPQEAGNWAADYRAHHGIRAEGLIERLGLGEDGRVEERRRKNSERDRGFAVSRQPLHGP